jgi:glutamyl-tRNA reductase
MHILVVGFNHKTAPVSLRERMAFSENEWGKAVTTLRHTKSILESVIVSTCNRMELYVICDQLHTGEYYAKTFLEEWFSVPKSEFVDHLYIKQNDEAVRHLFTVVCGLDSMVIGETQILGQVRDAFLKAQEQQTTGTMFNTLFRQAITLGKRAHAETELGQNAVSVSYAAVELGKKLFPTFSGKTVLLIGAGETGQLTAKHFQANGADRMIVLNRTWEKAREVAAHFGAEARSFTQLHQSLREADIVVSSTGASGAIITREMIKRVLPERTAPLFLIDIAVPRDIEPDVHELDNVYLYDIDDLQEIVSANLQLREQEAEKVRHMIEEEVRVFRDWVQTLGVVPLITALREKALAIQEETMKSIERKLPDLTERELRVIRKHTKSIVNQMLRDPIMRVKELAARPDRDEALEMFAHIFALEESLKKEQAEERKQAHVPSMENVAAPLRQPAFAGGKVTFRS